MSDDTHQRGHGRERCPFCGSPDLDYDEVDIGVGIMTSPPGRTWPARWEAARGKWETSPSPTCRATRELWVLLGEEAMRARAERAARATTVQRIAARLDELLAERNAEARAALDDDAKRAVVDRERVRQWVETGMYPDADNRAVEAVREPGDEPQQYERRMGQPSQAPEQLVAVRPDLRGEATSDATADELRMELALLRQEHDAVRRALRAAQGDDVVELAQWYVNDGAGETLAEVREALGCEDGEDVVEAARAARRATGIVEEVRWALEAGQWARAAELAGCGGGDE